MAYRNPKTGLGGGYRRKSLPLKPIALQGASHEIVSPLLQFRWARTGHENPPRLEIRKNYEKITKSPTLGWAPKIRKYHRKKYKNGHFRAIFAFVLVFFSYFRGPTQRGGFCNCFAIFFVFPALGVFVPCTSPTESQRHSRYSGTLSLGVAGRTSAEATLRVTPPCL